MAESNLKAQLTDAMKAAMKAQDKDRLSVIRLVMSALKQKEVDERIELTDQHVIDILNKMVKQRKDSVSQYRDAKRDDLADKEQAEIEVINEFLPAPLSEAEVEAIIAKVIADTGATTMKDMGKVMGQVKQLTAGRADMGAVSAVIKQKLS